MKKLKYISHYPQAVQQQVQALIEANKLEQYLLNKYPLSHNYTNDKSLFMYVQDMKNEYMKKTAPLSKAVYDGKINVIHNALGTHHFISRVQGGKLKAKNEIRVASLFKNTPEEFLQMIVVHELAHFKEKEHNKAFYKLCEHMFREYHQVEFDLRVYLTHIELEGKIASWNQ
ncbi:YgjP-like metallopeptidase domain-containing protein [Sulfurimonas sp.]|uniref:YgjP-like metallopeptidase domain-containing protein n=1 Tax=Sulfurimonas sp. TaxID=2022749 RepID=UPI003D135E0C